MEKTHVGIYLDVRQFASRQWRIVVTALVPSELTRKNKAYCSLSLDFTYRQRRLLVVASAASSLVRDALEHIIHKGVRDLVRDASVWVGLLEHTVYVYNLYVFSVSTPLGS